MAVKKTPIGVIACRKSSPRHSAYKILKKVRTCAWLFWQQEFWNGSFMRLFKTPSPRAIYGGGRTCRKTVVFRQSETPIGVIPYILSSFLSSKRSLRGGNGLPLPLNLVVRRVLSYVPTFEWQTLSAPMIKWKKTPRKKCSFMAKEEEKR